MKIPQKFILAFLLLLACAIGGAYWAFQAIKENSLNSFEGRASSIASDILLHLDEGIMEKVKVFQELSKTSRFLQEIVASNEEFALKENLQEFIEINNKEWFHAQNTLPSPFINGVLNNALSSELQETAKFHQSIEGYVVFPQIIVTNKHGAIIALEGSSDDYRQADKQWWQRTLSEGFYTGNLQYSESAGTYVLNFGIRINDAAGKFEGAMKLTLSVDEIIHLMERLTKTPTLKSFTQLQSTLTTNEGAIIHSSDGTRFVDGKRLFLQQQEKGFFLDGDYYVIQSASHEKAGMTKSAFILLLGFHEDDVLAPALTAGNILLLLLLFFLVLAALMGFLLYGSIFSPLKRLRKAAGDILAGNHDIPMNFTSNDEFGEVAGSFKEIAEQLKNTTSIRDNLLAEAKSREIVEAELRKNEESLANAQKIARLGNWDWDITTNNVYWSDEVYRIFGQEPQAHDLRYEAFLEFIHPEDRWNVQKSINDALKTDTTYSLDHRIVLDSKEEKILHAEGSVTFDKNGNATHLSGTIQDVTASRKQQQRLENNVETLEYLATGATSLKDILTKIALVTEKECSGLLCAIQLLDEEGKRLVHGAAPSLPDSYNNAVDGLEIRDGNCAFDTAVLTGKLVVAENIHTHPFWEKLRSIASGAGLVSCWIQPIFSSHGKVLGTFAQYYQSPRRASNDELKTLANSAHLAGIAIERHQMQAELEKERSFLHGIVENNPTVIVVKDREGRIELVNHQWETVSGYKRKDAIGKTVFDLYPNDVAKEINQRDKKVLESKKLLGFEETMAFPSGTTTFLSLKFPLFGEDGEVRNLCNISTDITEQKNTEEALKVAKEGAEAANQAKSEFLASMSHEIRTPMNAILGMADLLKNTKLNDEQREYVEINQHAGKNLLQIINDILDYSKIEAGQMEVESNPFDLQELVEGVCETLAKKAHGKGLELAQFMNSDIPTGLLGDSSRLRQVLHNLLENAIKFTDTGEVDLIILKDGESNNTATLNFLVSDTGIGIPDEKISLIFQGFTQGDSSITRKHGGIGLGLAISQFLVKKMGGEVQANSKPGKGSTFSFSLEFKKQDEFERRKETRARTEPIQNLPLLLVCPDTTSRHCLEEMLASWNASVCIADSRDTMLRKINDANDSSNPFKIIVVNEFPELIAEIGKTSFSGTILPLLRTNNLDEKVARIRKAGIKMHLVKPVKRSVLLEGILSILKEEKSADVSAPRPTTNTILQEKQEQGIRVLLVEDDLTNQKVASMLLEKLGYVITLAENGIEAISRFQEGGNDVILMDVNMPEMDGIEATKEIRRIEKKEGGHIPIIAVTALVFKEDKEKCFEAGMDAYVPKPIRIKAIVDAIKKFVPHEGVKKKKTAIPPQKIKPLRAVKEPVIDEAGLLERTFFDKGFMKVLYDIFIQEVPKELAAIEDAIARQDGKGVKETAHKLKGSLSNMGGKVTQKTALKLEIVGLENDFETAGKLFIQLKEEVEAFKKALSAFVERQ